MIPFKEICIHHYIMPCFCANYTDSLCWFFLFKTGRWLVCLALACDLSVYLHFFFGLSSFLLVSCTSAWPCSYFLLLFSLSFLLLIFWGRILVGSLFLKMNFMQILCFSGPCFISPDFIAIDKIPLMIWWWYFELCLFRCLANFLGVYPSSSLLSHYSLSLSWIFLSCLPSCSFLLKVERVLFFRMRCNHFGCSRWTHPHDSNKFWCSVLILLLMLVSGLTA